MQTSELISLLKIKSTYGAFPKEVTEISQDSREVDENYIFVAVKGHNNDGYDFIDSAINNGCRFIISDRYKQLSSEVGLLVVKDVERVAALFSEYIYQFPHKDMTLVGVTGTNGKTTVASMIHELTLALNYNSAYLGTNGFMLNNDHFKSVNTTPETTRLHRNLKKAKDKDTDVFVMEVSSHGLVLGRTSGLDFDIVAFTNLSQDHLDFHQTMEAYGNAKALLFSQLGQDLSKRKYVILNNDDKWSHEYRRMTPHEVITYGMNNDADFYPSNIQGDLNGFRFTLNTPIGSFEVQSPFIGTFNIQNLMCAIITMWSSGHELNNIIQVIPSLKAVEGRLEVISNDLPIDIIIDFAHTPDALNKIIDTIQPFVKNKLIFLVGMTGERDQSKGREMGEIATRADYAIFTPDNPANDDPEMLVQLLEQGATHKNFQSFIDREEGIRHAIQIAEAGDTVVLACKGREPYQIMKNYVKVPHRDDLIALDEASKIYRSY